MTVNNKPISLSQLTKTVVSLKNYVDYAVPSPDKYILDKTITLDIDPNTATMVYHNPTNNLYNYIYNIDITGLYGDNLYTSFNLVPKNNNASVTNNGNEIVEVLDYAKTTTKANINKNNTHIVNSNQLAIAGMLYTVNYHIELDESGNLVYTNDVNSATIRFSRTNTYQKNDTENLFNDGFTLYISFYKINTKIFAGDYYNIPYNLKNGSSPNSLAQVNNEVNSENSIALGTNNKIEGNTSTSSVLLGTDNTGLGLILGRKNTSSSASANIIGNYNKITGPAYAWGENNTVNSGYTIGLNNNTSGVNIAIGNSLTTTNPKDTNKGAMILGAGGTLSNDTLFAISTALRKSPYYTYDPDSIRYPFEAKDNGDTYLRGKNILVEIDDEISNEKSIVNKKYVDDLCNNLVIEDKNKYLLVTCDDPVTIKPSNITDIESATITIDNLIGKFGTLTNNNDGTYTYTFNTIMTDVETLVFKVNDNEQKLLIVPYREMKYDDTNLAITYNGTGWATESNAKFYNKNAHKSTDSNDTAVFSFKGTGFSVISKLDTSTSQVVIRGSGGSSFTSIISLDSNVELYGANIYSKERINYDTYSITLNTLTNTNKNTTKLYIDSIIIYDTLGTILNDSVRSLYYDLDNNIGVLRTDKENSKFTPTNLYDPATKKYVDETVTSYIDNSTEATNEEVNTMLEEILGGDYSGKN